MLKVVFSKCSEAIDKATETKTFGCFYSENNDANENIHIHECCEILFCLSGGKTFFIDDRIYDVSDGDIFIINQFEAHKINANPDKTFKRWVMQVDPAFMYAYSTAETNLSRCFNIRGNGVSHKLSPGYEERERLCHIFGKMSAEHEYGDDVLKNIAAVELVAEVNRIFYEKNIGYIYHRGYENETLLNVLKYIKDNYSQQISLESIAKNCFISVNELCRLFKKHMGTTVNKYIVSQRMTEAKKLLKSGMSVALTAEKCGFLDYTSFIRSFKKTVGVPPGQYKK